MKSKTIFSSLLFFFALFFITPQVHAAQKGKAKISIVITNNTTAHQLDSIKTALATQGVVLDIEGTVYTKAGQLRSISGSIKFSDKESATFKSDNVGLITITQKGTAFKIESKDLPAQ